MKSEWRFLSLCPLLWPGLERACLMGNPSWNSVSINSPSWAQNWGSLPGLIEAQCLVSGQRLVIQSLTEWLEAGVGPPRVQHSDWPTLGHVPTSPVSGVRSSFPEPPGLEVEKDDSRGKAGPFCHLLGGQKELRPTHSPLSGGFRMWTHILLVLKLTFFPLYTTYSFCWMKQIWPYPRPDSDPCWVPNRSPWRGCRVDKVLMVLQVLLTWDGSPAHRDTCILWPLRLGRTTGVFSCWSRIHFYWHLFRKWPFQKEPHVHASPRSPPVTPAGQQRLEEPRFPRVGRRSWKQTRLN